MLPRHGSNAPVVIADVGSVLVYGDRGRGNRLSESPSLRTGRADLPHPALQSVVLPQRGVMNNHPVAAESTAGDQRQNRLGIRAITMGTRPEQRSRFHRWRTETPAGTARRHSAEEIYAAVHPCSSTFLRPFAPSPLQALLRSYGRSDSCSPGSSALCGREHRLHHEQVSLIHAHDLPAILSPTTCGRSVSPRHVTCRWIEPRWLPHEAELNGNSGLRHSLADSPHHAGRIEFLSVRTGRSPPAAPHPVSPRRSCRLITSYVNSERTSTSLIVCALRRTSAGLEPGTCLPKGRRYRRVSRWQQRQGERTNRGQLLRQVS